MTMLDIIRRELTIKRGLSHDQPRQRAAAAAVATVAEAVAVAAAAQTAARQRGQS